MTNLDLFVAQNSIEWLVSLKLSILRIFAVIVCWFPWWVLKTENVNWLIDWLIDWLIETNLLLCPGLSAIEAYRRGRSWMGYDTKFRYVWHLSKGNTCQTWQRCFMFLKATSNPPQYIHSIAHVVSAHASHGFTHVSASENHLSCLSCLASMHVV